MESLASVIKEGVKTGMINAKVAYPAIVETFDPSDQTITAYIAIQQIVDGQNVSLPILVDVPIMIPTVQGFHITLPIKKGDEVVVIFADRCIDAWFENGGIQKQSEHRVHHISDGMAYIGINSKKQAIDSYDPDNLVIRNNANNQKMTFKVNGDIDVETTANVNVTCVNATINSSKTTVNASSVEVNSPISTFNGNVAINGSLTQSTGSSGSNAVFNGKITATDDVIGGGISLKGHTHTGDSGGTTSPPN